MERLDLSDFDVWPNQSPEHLTAVDAVRSAVAVHVASRQWLFFPVIIHIAPNMKLLLLSALCFCSLFLAGCTSSSGPTGKSASPAATTKSSVYDPTTDTTTIKNGGYEWRLKGNQTNMMIEARQ